MPTKLTEEEFLNRMNDIPNIECLEKFSGCSSRMHFRCKICGHVWDTKAMNIITLPVNKRSGCPKCANERRKKHLHQADPNYLVNLLTNRPDGNDYEWLDKDYNRDNKIKLKIYHKPCGSVFFIRPNDFQQGYGCPGCNKDSLDKHNHYIYLKELRNEKTSEHFLKIGISNSIRIFQHYKSTEIFRTKPKLTKASALYFEDMLLEKYKPLKFMPLKNFNGASECLQYSSELIENLRKDFSKIKNLV